MDNVNLWTSIFYCVFLVWSGTTHSYVLMHNQKAAVEHQKKKKKPLTHLMLDISTTRWYHVGDFKL